MEHGSASCDEVDSGQGQIVGIVLITLKIYVLTPEADVLSNPCLNPYFNQYLSKFCTP